MPDISNFDSLIFQNILDVSPAHVYWKNRDGVYLGANRASLNYFGFKSLEEILGRKDCEIIDSASAKHVREIDLEVMKSGKLSITKEIDMRNGNVFLSYKAPLLNRNNEIVGIVGHSVEVTKQEQKERRLVEQNYSFSNWSYK